MKNPKWQRRALQCLLGLAMGLSTGTFAQSARPPMEPVAKIKLGTFKSAVDSGSALAQTRGYFKSEGLEVEFVTFASSGDAMQALALGQVDAVPGPVNAGLFNILARGIPLKIVASAGDQPKGFGTIALVIREDLVKSGRYKGPADLKGLKLSIPGRTSPAHFFMKEIAARGGLALKDLDLVFLGLSENLPAMANKSLDGVITLEPFVAKTVKEAPGVRMVGMDEVKPGFPVAYLMYSPDFAKRSPEAARRFMIAYLRGDRDYAAAFTGTPRGTEQVIRELQASHIAATTASVPLGMDPDGRISFSGVDEFAKWLKDEGAIKEGVDLRSFVDDSFREFAVKTLAGEARR